MTKSLRFSEHDVVRIIGMREQVRAVQDGINRRNPLVGDVATVVMVYADPLGYELECCDAEGVPWFLVSVSADEVTLELVHSADITRS